MFKTHWCLTLLNFNVNFNNNTNINLEMQVSRQPYWCERSLCYLCRTYDQLGKGEDYSQIKPAVHIGFLDFTLFPDVPEFYATYKMLNIKNHHLYSDKFILSVVDLNHIKLATEEDKAYGIDYWAKLFRATTWEELKMIANKNEILEEASASLYKMNANEAIRELCQAREDYYRIQNSILSKLETVTVEKEQLETEKNTLLKENIRKDEIIAGKDAKIADKDAEIAV